MCIRDSSQVENGADVLDVNVGAAGIDEVEVLPMAVKAVMAVSYTHLTLPTIYSV